MPEYKLIEFEARWSDQTIGRFENQVTTYLQSGWHLAGGPIFKVDKIYQAVFTTKDPEIESVPPYDPVYKD